MQELPGKVLFTAFIVVFAILFVGNYFLTKAGLDKIGRKFCLEHGYKYLGIKHAKSHFSVVYETGGKRRYAKFIARTGFFGNIRRVDWIA